MSGSQSCETHLEVRWLVPHGIRSGSVSIYSKIDPGIIHVPHVTPLKAFGFPRRALHNNIQAKSIEP